MSSSDYTSFLKAQAASQSYRNGAVPIPIQTRDQPYTNQSALNAQLLTSRAAFTVNAAKSSITGLASVRPNPGKGYVNQPKNLSTVHLSTSTTYGSSSVNQAGGLPTGRGNPTNVGTMRVVYGSQR